MTQYATNNPLGSTDARDLFDNIQNADFAVNSITQAIWRDRFGKNRKTFWGMEQQFSAQMSAQAQQHAAQITYQKERFNTLVQNSGYEVIGNYESGPLTVTDYNQLVRYNNELWKLTASTPVPYTTTTWSVDSTRFVSAGDAALRNELVRPSGAKMVGLEQGGSVQDAIHYTTPEMFGYGPVGSGTASFAAAAAEAVSKGVYVKLDGKQYDIGITPVDLQGASVVGNSNTSVNGYFKNPGKIMGFKYGLLSVGQTELKSPRVFQLPTSSVSGKFLVNFASNPDIWGIGMHNDRSVHRDTFMIMRRGNGGDSSPWEHIRSQQIYYGQTFAYQALAAAILSGTFTDFSVTPIQAGYPAGWGSSFAGYNLHVIAKRTTNPGDYIERVVQPDKDGYVNVGVYIVSTGSAFSISVDGNVVVNATTRMTTPGVRIRTLRVYVGIADSVTLRVTHTGVAGQGLTVLGFNLHRPRETHSSIAYDKFALYYDGSADYAAGVGAGDYAMSNDALGFFGSYHGGEVALTPPVWRVDGTTLSTFVPEKPYAGSAIDLMEKTRIHDIVDTNVYQRWAGNGRHEMSITLKGTNGVPFEVSKMYLGMNGTYDAFSRIIYPEYAEGITGASTPDFLCGMTNMVVQENPTTGQLVYTHCNIEEGFPSAKGGVFVKTTDETGASYQKVYYAWVYDSPMKINKVSAQLVKVFC